MKLWILRGVWVRTWLASGTMLAFGGCGLSDQQLAQIYQTVITTGLTSLVSSLTSSIVGAGA